MKAARKQSLVARQAPSGASSAAYAAGPMASTLAPQTTRLTASVLTKTSHCVSISVDAILGAMPVAVSPRFFLGSDEDLVGQGFAARALEREFGALLVLFDQGFEQTQRASDHFGVGGRLGALFQAL